MEVTLLTTDTEYNIKDKIKISKQDLTKLNSINPSFYITDLIKEERDYYEISIFHFQNFLEDIIFKTDLIYNYSGNLKSNSLKLNQNFEKLRKQYFEIRGNIPYNTIEATTNRKRLINKIISRNIEKLNPFLNLLVEFTDSHKKVNKLNDLIKAKNNILTNLQRINENISKEFALKYDQAINESNLEKLEQLLIESQKLITKHFQEFITPIDKFNPEKPFYFLCHSICNYNFSGDFYSNFVSSSLITKDLTDTFNQGFGFILSPNHIVLACSQDMFVNNNALDTDTLSNSSTIPEINIPEIIIEQALKQKKENQQKNEKRKVYTEIVSNKFEPIAIFCMTDGSKTLNLNYQKALKLKKNYSNLKIIEIDKTLYKKDLSQEKKQLIFNVEYHISGNILNDQTDYDRYDYFFNKFLELKKTNNYTVNDIITLYKKNKEMLSVFLDFDNIFKNYDIDSIKFILLNNYKTNLKTIFNGTFRSFILKNIYDTLKNNDSNKLNEVFPGLGTFIEIFPKVNINDEIINIIKQGKKIDFSYINQILIKEIKYQQQNNLQELLNLKKQLENLKKDKIVKEEEIEKINKCNDFTNKLYLYFIVTNDIKDEKNKIEGNEFTKQILNTNLKTLEISLDNKKIELKKVQKIKIFNLSKIKKIKEELNILNTQIEQIKKEITTKNQEIIVLKNNITSFNQKFKKEVGCDIDDYLKLHSQALNFLNRQNLYLNQFELNQINNNIEKITSQIVILEKDIKILEEIPNQNKK